MSETEKTENVNITNEEHQEKENIIEEVTNKVDVTFDEESDPEEESPEEEGEEEEKKEKEYIDNDSGDDFKDEEEEEEENNIPIEEEEEEDDDFEINNNKTKKKRKRKEKTTKTTKTTKKKKKTSNSLEQKDLDEEEEEGEISSGKTKQKSEENEEFDKMMKEFKIVKGKKFKDSDEISNIEEQAEKMAKNLIETMKQALEEDNESLLNKKPATSKLKILNSVVAACSKSFLQPQLLEEKLLDILSEWIKPTIDKQLPNMNIRTAVFKILSEIPVKGVTKRVKSQVDFDGIEVSHLRGSEIGKLIKMYSIHPKETKENRKMASLIIEKWSRMIFDLSDDYKSTNQSPKGLNKKRLLRLDSEKNKKQEEEEEIKSARARIPRKVGFDFVRQPKSKIEDDLKRSVHETTESEKVLQRKLRDLSRKPKF